MTRSLGLLAGLLLCTPLLATPAAAQSLETPALSPKAMVMQRVGVVDITVTYSSPGKRDREIWGSLVPWGELWRTGANSATTLETSGPITVGGKKVPAGTYAIFSIPGEKEWTVILNKNPNQGGTGSYDESLDQARFKVVPQSGADRERLQFQFTDTTETSTRLDLVWDGVRVEMPIEVDTGALVMASVDAYVESVAGGLTSAARYHADQGNYDQAIKLIDTAMSIEQNWMNTWLKAEFLHKQGSNAKLAYKLAVQAHDMGKKADNFFWEKRVAKAVDEWPKK